MQSKPKTSKIAESTKQSTQIKSTKNAKCHRPLNLYFINLDSRLLPLFIALFCICLVLFSHFFLQGYLFMRPCEQCVYIRYAFLAIAFGALLASFKGTIFKLFGFIIGVYGAIRGIMYSLALMRIHRALENDDIFGLSGCSSEPTFDFGLPLERWLPSLFSPTGDCALDYPLPPSDIEFSMLQKILLESYENGWFLIPSLHFGNMAQCCFCAFIACLLAFIVIFSSQMLSALKRLKH